MKRYIWSWILIATPFLVYLTPAHASLSQGNISIEEIITLPNGSPYYPIHSILVYAGTSLDSCSDLTLVKTINSDNNNHIMVFNGASQISVPADLSNYLPPQAQTFYTCFRLDFQHTADGKIYSSNPVKIRWNSSLAQYEDNAGSNSITLSVNFD
ncbi:MAG: hypothetical protein KIT27_05805 [Legionellales bacterium]|nr:hypothetical protein [Legionellales bacterium]